MRKLSTNVKILAVLLLIFVFCDFLISPVVFETRSAAIIGNPSSFRWLVLLFGGLILNVISLILLYFKPRIATLFAIVGSIAYLAVTIGDQLGMVTPLKPPIPVTIIEVVAFD
jgi:hypothetical protein